MKCYLCGVDQYSYKLGIRDICWNCKIKTDRAKRKIKFSTQWWVVQEQQIKDLTIALFKRAL